MLYISRSYLVQHEGELWQANHRMRAEMQHAGKAVAVAGVEGVGALPMQALEDPQHPLQARMEACTKISLSSTRHPRCCWPAVAEGWHTIEGD